MRALQRPPQGVRIVIEAVCIMREVKPKKVAGEKMGQKVDDYWEPGKAILQDPSMFLDSLFKFDKVCKCILYMYNLCNYKRQRQIYVMYIDRQIDR